MLVLYRNHPRNISALCVKSQENRDRVFLERQSETMKSMVSFQKLSQYKGHEKYILKYGYTDYQILTYDNNLGIWQGLQRLRENTVTDLAKLRRVSMFLDARALYVKLRTTLQEYLIKDVIVHILSCGMPDIDLLHGVVVK